MHEESASNSHLRRLRRIFLRDPIFFLTSTVADRRPVLAFEQGHETLVREWKISAEKYGWRVGRYAVMPDHVHFFAAETPRSRPREESQVRLQALLCVRQHALDHHG